MAWYIPPGTCSPWMGLLAKNRAGWEWDGQQGRVEKAYPAQSTRKAQSRGGPGESRETAPTPEPRLWYEMYISNVYIIAAPLE